MPPDRLRVFAQEVERCALCPRLVAHREAMAREKRRAYRDWEYWGKPVPPFGDLKARLMIVGLAPAAHGGNRTGRMFTGDRSGDYLYRALYETAFASQPHSVSRDDGMRLTDVYITSSVRCAPPDNQPTPEEFRMCSAYLNREVVLLKQVQVVVALGKLGFDAYLRALKEHGVIAKQTGLLFGHDRVHDLGENAPVLISSYHPSQQNTSTGRLTAEMLHAVFARARRMLR